MAFSTPVLFLVFNRPLHTQKVIARLRQIQPQSLFVSADGPRPEKDGEAGLCQAVRDVIGTIDWPCDIQTRYLETNKGCREAVQTGIDWFFSQVEGGIILEDDCLPDLTFFDFCETLLSKYRDDPSVMHIGGYNPSPGDFKQISYSYIFSKHPMIWGWASWRRAWAQNRAHFEGLEAALKNPNGPIHTLDRNPTANRYVLDKFVRVKKGEINTWDYAWFYTLLIAEGLAIVPKVNLVENIGFDAAATHTKSGHFSAGTAAKAMPFPLVHPPDKRLSPRLESRIFRSAQKNSLGLLLRRLFPTVFFKDLNL
jgi:hypothetical protein